MRFIISLLLFSNCVLFADVSRFIDSVDFSIEAPETQLITKSSAFISSQSRGSGFLHTGSLKASSDIILNREILEKRLGESISHRYQTSGRVVAFMTREWNPITVSPNYLVKISSCSPDELCPSTFTRFSIWDKGNLVGSFAEPLRIGHYVDVLFSKSPLSRGVRLNSVKFAKKAVDILKMHAGSVPASAKDFWVSIFFKHKTKFSNKMESIVEGYFSQKRSSC